ncbi:MAG: hypothetical protein C0404_00655 [Verrucomicrobia bacterium]|nr:hypothetical protein [Verrucomicrobiota bacterium]
MKRAPKYSRANMLLQSLAVACSLIAGTSLGSSTEVYLRAGLTTNTMPDGRQVVMWGFARDTAFGARDGVVSVPGPALEIRPDSTSLVIYLDNDLPEPVSVVIPGLICADAPVPVRATDGRALSFTHEAAPGNTVAEVYTWNDLRPGSFLYESGSHSAVQIQMGLYGFVKKDAAFGQPYPGVLHNGEVILLYSEIDPSLHDAVATGNYGTNKAMTSTIDYEPKYFLVNGHSYTNGMLPLHAGRPGDTILLRFLNAGLGTRVPIVNGAYLRLVAEDGFAYPYPRDQYSVFLPAGKTMDALFTSGVSNVLAVYDRRLGLVNGQVSPGGMLTYLDVSQPVQETVPPAWWLQQYFGAGPYPTNVMPAYIAGLDPTNPASLFQISSVVCLPADQGTEVSFRPTTTNRLYDLESTANLMTGPWTPVYSNVPGSVSWMYLVAPATSTNKGAFFRVSVRMP